MIRPVRQLACAFLLLGTVLTGWLPQPSPRDLPDGLQLSYSAFNPFTLRKVHLIRPDLIPYPFTLDVYC